MDDGVFLFILFSDCSGGGEFRGGSSWFFKILSFLVEFLSFLIECFHPRGQQGFIGLDFTLVVLEKRSVGEHLLEELSVVEVVAAIALVAHLAVKWYEYK